MAEPLKKIEDEWANGDPDLCAGLERHRAMINALIDALDPLAPGAGGGVRGSAAVILTNGAGERVRVTIAGAGAISILDSNA